MEAGCGSGITSIHISRLGYKVTGIDIDREMLAFAKNLKNETKTLVNFEIADLYDLGYKNGSFDLIFSSGVLEHFDDENIVKIINSEIKASSKVIISVPSMVIGVENKIFGDERLMSKDEWLEIIKKTNGEVLESFEFAFSNSLYFFLNKILKGSFSKKACFFGFVLRKRRGGSL